MKYSPQVWDQLKNITADDLIKGLEKSGWIKDESRGNFYVYLHPRSRRRVTIHYHPHKTYGPKLLKGILESIDWSEEEMRRIKLIK
ncbi:type II toxin-antitoxin system HicA family toxin [Candidatus Poribacteria bacterium]|nr:type II toxin-antitoxin system HicA family toxin [Candidatus Poribacteria bacterium]